MSYYGRLNDNEELNEEDKTPYDSISSRPPISNPRGRNPATENDQSGPPTFDLTLPNASQAGEALDGKSFLDFFHERQSPRSNVSEKVKSSIRDRIGSIKKGQGVRNPAGLNPANQSAINRIKESVDYEDSAPPIDQMGGSAAAPGQLPPSQMGGSAAAPGQLPPSATEQPPIPPPQVEEPPAPAPMSPPAPSLPPPPEPPIAPTPPIDFGGMAEGNQFGNYYLAGVQGAQGGMKPQNQNVLGLELNKQNTNAMNLRSKVARAIAAKKGATDHFDQNMDFQKLKYRQGRFDSLNKALSEEIGAGSTPFAIAAKNKQLIDNVRQLILGKKNPDDLNPQEVFEIAKSLDKILSGGQPTAAGTGHLTPNNAGTWIAEAVQHFSNTTRGAKAGEYVRNIHNTLQREYDQAEKTLSSFRNKRFSTVQDLKRDDPQQWNEIMTRHRLNEDGTRIPPATPPGGDPNKRVINGVMYTKVPGGWESDDEIEED